MALATLLAPMSQAGSVAAGMPLPPLSLTGGAGGSARSDATGGMAEGYAVFDNSGFTVNYAPSIGVGASALPSWVWIGALLLGVVWLKRKA
jgi:hypothetical protein